MVVGKLKITEVSRFTRRIFQNRAGPSITPSSTAVVNTILYFPLAGVRLCGIKNENIMLQKNQWPN